MCHVFTTVTITLSGPESVCEGDGAVKYSVTVVTPFEREVFAFVETSDVTASSTSNLLCCIYQYFLLIIFILCHCNLRACDDTFMINFMMINLMQAILTTLLYHSTLNLMTRQKM